MSIVPRLEISQKQSLVMTQKLRQAIDMLQMNNVELSEMVAVEIEKNPLLEKENFDEKVEVDKDFKEAELDIDVDNQFNNANEDFEYRVRGKNNSFEASDFDMDMLEGKGEESLYSCVLRQVESNFKDEKDLIIASNFLNNLENSGYFVEGFKLDEFAKNLGISLKKATEVLNKLQKFEPSGVFARNLKETLTIQLKAMNRYDEMMALMLDNLEILGKKDLAEMKRVLKANDEDIMSMISDIKLCNPKPGASFGGGYDFHVIPDVLVKEDGKGNFRVELNPNNLIRPLINRQYMADLKSGSKDKKLHKFLNDNEASASWLIRAVDQRNQSILKVASEIVLQQMDFFNKGVDHLKPLNLSDVAEVVELDESTVSRVTSGKYMATNRGVFDMKFFFPSKLASSHSSEAVKHKIKQLIDDETATTVLSDEDISIYLKKLGINVARRTVLKYRESLGIKPSNIRKREKKLLLKKV